MTIGISVKNSIPMSEVREKTSRDWHAGGGLGLSPKYARQTQSKLEGVGESPKDRIRYEKGYERMMGHCDKCEFYKGKQAKQGQHCRKRRCVK
jgi:hypothetical protein